MVPRPPKKKENSNSDRIISSLQSNVKSLGSTTLRRYPIGDVKVRNALPFPFFWLGRSCLPFGLDRRFFGCCVLVVCDLFVTLVCGYWWQVVRQTASFTWTTAEATTIVAEATIVGETATKEEQQEEQEQKQEQEQEQQPIQHLSMSLGFVLETFQQNESIHAGIVGSTSRWIQGGENLDETTLNVSWGDGRKPLIFNSSQVPCFGWVSRLPLDL